MWRIAAAALVLAIGAGVASAQETDASPAPQLIPLAELTSLVHMKSAVLAGSILRAGADGEAIRTGHVARLAAFLGSMRAEAGHPRPSPRGGPRFGRGVAGGAARPRLACLRLRPCRPAGSHREPGSGTGVPGQGGELVHRQLGRRPSRRAGAQGG